ncbi:MAG: hypothetical protein RLO80_12625 [Hyphomonas sp.]
MLSLLSTLLSLTNVNVGAAVSRGASGFGYMFIAILLLLTAYLLGIGALAVFLAERLSLWAALAVIAGGLVIAAGLILWRASVKSKEAKEQLQASSSARKAAGLGALTALGAGASGRSLILAALAGLLANELLSTRNKSKD